MSIPRLHVLTPAGSDPLLFVREALDGGADAIQLRLKDATDDEVRRVGEIVRPWCEAAGAALIIDDRVAVAASLGVGVHVGPHDAPPAEARAAVGSALVGATVNDLQMLDALLGAPIDYIGVGPVFPTTSKAAPKPVIGLDGLAEIARRSPWPVIAIGGVGLGDVGAILDAGAHGVAVIAAVAHDTRRATASFAAALAARGGGRR